MKKKIKSVAVVITVCIAVGGVMFWNFQYKNQDLKKYTERLLNISLEDCMETAEGEVEIDIMGEEFSLIKFRVKDGEEEKAVSIFKDRCGMKNYYDPSQPLPGYCGHRFAKEIKEGEILFLSSVSMEGRWAKTRFIEIYVVLDEKGQMYIYVMG